MSHKHIREENKINSSSKNLPVVSKCLAIVLVPKSRKNSGNVLDNDETHIDSSDGNVVQSSEVQKALSPSGYNGKELLQDFKIRNKTCYWNPSLVESIKSLEYKGFVEPSTILVTGEDIHLENLRSAWGRRVLKAPGGFTIDRIGDVNGIQMQVIPQTQFMPLPDALCSIIMDLNMRRIVATLDVIYEKLSHWYKDMTVPSQQLVFETLGNLIKDRKVFHTGSGYFVVTPDTNRLQSNSNSSYLPTNASWLPYHPMYVPVFQGQVGQQPPMLPSRAHMRSISCQVTTIEESSDEEELPREKLKNGSTGKSSRASSLGRTKEEKKVVKSKSDEGVELKRSSSIKYKGDKGSKMVKDVNLNVKSNNINQEKEKGEKTSIFSKIFGRKKRDKDKDKLLMPPPPVPPLRPSTVTEVSNEGKEPKEKEYATFSAQFPPPEWLWYQQQLDKQKRTESWVSVVTQQTTRISSAPYVSKVTTLPPSGARPVNDQRYQSTKKLQVLPQNVDYMAMNAITKVKDKKQVTEVATHESDFVKPRPLRPDNLYDSFRNSRHQPRKFRDLEEGSKHPTDYDVVNPADITPFQNSNVYHSVSALSPVAHLSDESTYAKLIEQPKLGPMHSTPRYEGQNDRTNYRVEGHEARDRIYGPPHLPHRRRSHRSRKRTHKIYSYYGQGDDISYEYKGRLPNKNSSTLQSRDSGVNCVGLAAAENKDKRFGGPVYENTTSKQYRDLPARNIANQSRVHFEDSQNSTNQNAHFTTDPALCSVVYQGDMTNPAAYNSVVYGSNVTDMVVGSSVMYHTITNSNLENSDLPVPQNSLPSIYYDNAAFGPKIMSLRSDINPKTVVDDHVNKLESVLEIGSPSAREISGSSGGMIELADAHDRTEIDIGNKHYVEIVEVVDDYESEEESDESDDDHVNSVEPHVQIEHHAIQPQPHALKKEDVMAKNGVDNLVSDSGFSSPRNPESGADKRAQTLGQSRSANDALVHGGDSSSDAQLSQPDNSTNSSAAQQSGSASSGLQASSDVIMATSSEQHSGSTTDNAEATAVSPVENLHQNDPSRPILRVKQSHSANSIKSFNNPQHSHHLYPQLPSQPLQSAFIHPYQPAAKMVPHPDVYNNNNTASVVYSDHSRPFHAPLHPPTTSLLNNQKPVAIKSKRIERPRSVDLWRNPPNELHKFEEEQLNKKYGVNGEFEVMGVL
ncbi:storkhead-box protein 1 [Biomphalaria glabrata]|nr:CAunnamed protein product [Biomphalaria glabrata]